MPKTLSNRRQALEDRFFSHQEALRMSELRGELTSKKNTESLREVCGIEDDAVLATLTNLKLGAQDVSALALTPLIHVAWADGAVSSEERSAVLKAAAEQGVKSGSHSHALLDAWLQSEPTLDLFGAWEAYVQVLGTHLSEEEMNSLKETIAGLAHDVASAAGGFLGIGSVSRSEQRALTQIADAFDR